MNQDTSKDKSTNSPTHDKSLVVIGNFDGVHRGHQAVVAEAVRHAKAQELVTTVLTFHPHPASVLGRQPPPLLTRPDRRKELLEALDPSVLVRVQPFDMAFAQQTPEQFAAWLVGQPLRAASVMVGKNFRFGKGRSGDFGTLEALGKRMSFETRAHVLISDAEGTLSSTRVRAFIEKGDLNEASAILGRPHMLEGLVVEGDRVGRTIGFATANLDGVVEAMPPHGVYAVVVDVGRDGDFVSLGPGAMNIGVRPTLGGPPALRVEVHMLDFDGDLYGQRLRVHLVGRIREERKFDGLAALKSQISTDVDAVQKLVATIRPGVDGRYF